MLHQIGVGALGPVFRTYEPTRDRLVAVKVFRLDITPEQAQALADELGKATTAALFHSSIVEPVDAGVEGTVAYRAEEYVAAESLDVAMRHYAPASLDKVLPFIAQLASAVDFARAAGVGHGALHPRDIFVTPDEARATGFGVVDALDRLGIRAPVRRPYSPPERIAGQPWSTPADVFSLAVIAFELLTGRRPSGVGEQMGPLTGAAVGPRAEQIKAVLARAMHEDPAGRYSGALDFASALHQAAGELAQAVDVEPELRKSPHASSADELSLREAAPIQSAAAAAASIDPIIAHLRPDPVEPPVEPPADLVLNEAADDDVALEMPRREDSAREVARRVIAAREKQRQAKTKAPEEPIEAFASESVEGPPPPTDAAPPIEVPPPIEDVPRAPATSLFTGTGISDLSPEPLTEADVPPAAFRTENELRDEGTPPVAPVLTVTPVAGDRNTRDEADAFERLLDVDDLHPHETSRTPRTKKKDRSRPRPPADLIAPEPDVMAHTAAPDPVSSIEPELHFSSFPDAHHAERPRVVMLPLAMALLLGMLIAYPAGYLVGSREQRADQTVQTSPAPPATPGPALQTPGTSGQTPAAGKDYSEQAVSPAAGAPPAGAPPATAPAVPADTAKPAAPAPTARIGRVVITSTPPKAGVTVNGRWSGRTPLTLDNLALGKYEVRVVEPGYRVASEQFALTSASATRTMSVKLQPEPARPRAAQQEAPARPAPTPAGPAPKPSGVTTGDIYVDSRPQGAKVFIDGKEYGVTPVRVPGQSVGPHVIRLELADHAPWTATERVGAGETAQVRGSLERIR